MKPTYHSPDASRSSASRPSLTRTSYSGSATTDHSPSVGVTDSATTSPDWENSDIRGDMAAGWSGSAATRGPSSEGNSSVPRSVGVAGRNTSSSSPLTPSTGTRAMRMHPQSLLVGPAVNETWGWRLNTHALRPLPPFYPLDPRASRRLLIADFDRNINEDNDVKMTALDEGAPVEEQKSGQYDGPGTSAKASQNPEPAAKASSVSPPSAHKALREITKHYIKDISHRISQACQQLSIQAQWDNGCPTATLFTMERVEMVVSLYLGGIDDRIDVTGRKVSASITEGSSPNVNLAGLRPASSLVATKPFPQVLFVELQRRKGSVVAFHTYRRSILDAAEGIFDVDAFHRTDGLEKTHGRDRCNQPRATLSPSYCAKGSLSRPSLRPSSFSADDAATFAGLKTEGENFDSPTDHAGDVSSEIIDKALVALNIAASLIKKDRVDARRLGMESLVLLTDPLRAGVETAKIASRVVLLGTAREDMIWKTNNLHLGFDNDDDVDALFDESAGLGIRETILEMIMGDDAEGKSSDDDHHRQEGIDKEFTDSLFNLCLSVLSNSLHAIEGSTAISDVPSSIMEDEEDRKPSPSNRRRAATEPAVRPSLDRNVTKRFIDDTNTTFGCDVLSSLIRILGQAGSNPHDAYHSARCLGVLFKGCGNSHKARARRDLDAKRIISAALEIGARTHAKLENASRVAMVALVTDDEESLEEEKTEVEYQDNTAEEQVTDEEMEEGNKSLQTTTIHPNQFKR